MKTKAMVAMLGGFALVLFLATSAHAQLPKRGEYTSVFGWAFAGKVMEIEKDHLWIYGDYSGTVFNDAGGGFLHQTAWVCSGSGHNVKGVYKGAGDCVATDADGDKALAVWKCEGGPRCDGDFQWTGGTGKFKGLRGNNIFNGGSVGTTNQGYSLFRGEWALPE
jgi:hypothetical protein